MRVKNLSKSTIEQGINKGNQARERIYKRLDINKTIPIEDLYELVLDDLKEKMQFRIIHDDILFNGGQQSVVALIEYKDGKEKKAGGTIKINPYYPEAAQIEAVFHEYMHIMEDSLPVYSTADNISTDSMFESETMGNSEAMADLMTNALIMPSKLIKTLLRKKKYNINEVLNEFLCLEKCTVIQWIVVNSLIPCHFSWTILPDGKIDEEIGHYDACIYNRATNPQYFDIDAILNIPYSAASQARDMRKNVNKPTIVGGIDYQCYAYYETNLRTDISNCTGKIYTVYYDRLIVIGWKKDEYNKMIVMMSDIDEISKD
jgi:hypothetical protein